MGKWALEVKESYFLNVPYVLFPMLFFWMRVTSEVPLAKKRPTRQTLGAIGSLLIAGMSVSVCFFMFRLMAVLGSPIAPVREWLETVEPYLADGSLYPQLQTILYGFYFIPAYCAAIRGVLYPDLSPWLPDVAATLAGAAAQGQFSYIFGATHPLLTTYPDPVWSPIPADSVPLFWAANLFVLAVPLLLLAWTTMGGHGRFGVRTRAAEKRE